MTNADDTLPRSARRRRRHRRRLRIALATTLGAVGLGGAALVLTDTVRLPGSDGPRVAAGDPAAPVATGADTPPTAAGPAAATAPRPLTPDAPLRLWIGGDSLAGSLGPSLGELTGATGVVQPQFDSRVSSGLINNPGRFGWVSHATEQMAELNPEAVVFIIGTNDYSTVPLGNEEGMAEWRADYARRTGEMMDILGDHGRRSVSWLGAPVLKDEDMNEAALVINAVMAEESRHHTDVVYIDAYEVFDDDEDGYTATLPVAEDGGDVRVRVGDGVHLTPEGGDVLAGAVFEILDARWHITQQAVPGFEKPVIQTKGSTQKEGTSRSTTATNAPPETAPPETAPPETEPTTMATTATEPTTPTTTSSSSEPPPSSPEPSTPNTNEPTASP